MSATEALRGSSYPIGGRLTDSALLKTWGAAVTGGWLVSQAVALVGTESTGLLISVVAFWLVGSLVPIAASFLWMRTQSVTALFPVWTVLGITGLIASFAVIIEATTIEPILVLGGLWFVGPAIGFLITAIYMTDWSRQLYAGAAVANLIGAVIVIFVPPFQAVYFTVAAVIQGLPMAYHGARLE